MTEISIKAALLCALTLLLSACEDENDQFVGEWRTERGEVMRISDMGSALTVERCLASHWGNSYSVYQGQANGDQLTLTSGAPFNVTLMFKPGTDKNVLMFDQLQFQRAENARWRCG